MFDKHYMSRAETRAMASDHPIGDPTGGASYGERNDPATAAVVVGSSEVVAQRAVRPRSWTPVHMRANCSSSISTCEPESSPFAQDSRRAA